MHNTEEKSLLFKKESIFYKKLLLFYPDRYRKQFGEEMLFVFEDMYQEELTKHGKISSGFWLSIFADTTKSIIAQHIYLIRKQGIKKYFNINKYNVIGIILLLPFILLLGSDFLGRLIQGNFTHPNTAFYNYLSQTILYSEFRGQAILLWIILVYSPLAALLLNVIPFFRQIRKGNKRLTLYNLLFSNPIGAIIIGLGLSFIVLAFGHDAISCFVNHLFSNGLNNLDNTIAICRKA